MDGISLKVEIEKMKLRNSSKKFSGAITTEIFKKKLEKLGFNVSSTNVFIEGIPYELDLLIYKKGTSPDFGILFKPENVSAVFELKSLGAIGKESVDRIKIVFDCLKKVNPNIKRIYVTITELWSNRQNRWYIHCPTEKTINGKVFILTKHNYNNRKVEDTGHWKKLVKLLENLIFN